MGKEQDYMGDLKEIRSMMERSSKFLSLSGWAGVMAGVYALAGAYIAYDVLNFNPTGPAYTGTGSADLSSGINLVLLALVVLLLAIGTAVYLSSKKAAKRGEKILNSTSRQLMYSMAVPLVSGGIFMLLLFSRGYLSLIAPTSLLFYGIALYNGGHYTYEDVKGLGLIQIALGLLGAFLSEHSLLIWAVGFGVVHIVYGLYMHIKYDR